MTKPTGRPGRARPSRPPVDNIKPPLTIDLASLALVVMFVAGIARGLLLLGNTAMLTRFEIHQNATAKHPKKDFDAAHALHQFREGAIVQGLVIGIALLLLAWALRRTRSASATRWALLVVFFFTQLPFYVVPISGLPVPSQVAGVILGAASIAAILLIFVPPASSKYFRACREANVPPELRGQPRPGLGSLFGPKRPRPAPGGRPAEKPVAQRPAQTRPGAPKSKAKVRADTEAVAKGAELARSRAKASKSRRTAD